MKGESGKKIKNTKQGGFLQVIIIILIALLIMKFFGITISEVIYRFKIFFDSVLR